MPPSTVPTNNDTKEENGFLEVTTDAQDDSIIWHPASEFLQQEDIAAYSFLVSPFIIDPATTDGIGFSRIVECLTQQLKLHVDKANSLISSNEKKPLFTEGVEASYSHSCIANNHLYFLFRNTSASQSDEHNCCSTNG